jgi:hypothetical protein
MAKITVARRKSKSSPRSAHRDPSPYLDRLGKALVRRANLIRKQGAGRVK